MAATPITYRLGTLADSRAVFDVFQESLGDLSQRFNFQAITGGQDPQVMAELWQRRQPMFDHLAQTAEHFWVAESGGEVVAYARSTLRDGVRQLTEFFAKPSVQSGGVGRELLARAFPREGARLRVVLATPDQRAVVRYLKAGVYPRGVGVFFGRVPEVVEVESDLTFEPIEAFEPLDALGAIDQEILGFRRDIDHSFLLRDRRGYLYRRAGRVVGYGYQGYRNGPFALLEDRDFPAALAHAERAALARGEAEFGVEVPMLNAAAVAYLFERKFEMETFVEYCMSDQPFGRLENYILTSPPFFL